ncbi:hypothetical protein IAT38_000942 [Cryptococcus sp. DSM 104549]
MRRRTPEAWTSGIPLEPTCRPLLDESPRSSLDSYHLAYDPDTHSGSGHTITSLRRLAPLHYLILRHLADLVPSKALSLSREVYDMLLPLLYRQVVACPGLYIGLDVEGVPQRRKLKALSYARVLDVRDMQGLWCTTQLSHTLNRPKAYTEVFPNVKKVWYAPKVLSGECEEDDRGLLRTLTATDLRLRLSLQMVKPYREYEVDPEEDEEGGEGGVSRQTRRFVVPTQIDRVEQPVFTSAVLLLLLSLGGSVFPDMGLAFARTNATVPGPDGDIYVPVWITIGPSGGCQWTEESPTRAAKPMICTTGWDFKPDAAYLGIPADSAIVNYYPPPMSQLVVNHLATVIGCAGAAGVYYHMWYEQRSRWSASVIVLAVLLAFTFDSVYVFDTARPRNIVGDGPNAWMIAFAHLGWVVAMWMVSTHDAESHPNFRHTITSLRRLPPLHYLILRHLADLVPSKTLALSREVYDMLQPLVYRKVIACLGLYVGLEVKGKPQKQKVRYAPKVLSGECEEDDEGVLRTLTARDLRRRLKQQVVKPYPAFLILISLAGYVIPDIGLTLAKTNVTVPGLEGGIVVPVLISIGPSGACQFMIGRFGRDRKPRVCTARWDSKPDAGYLLGIPAVTAITNNSRLFISPLVVNHVATVLVCAGAAGVYCYMWQRKRSKWSASVVFFAVLLAFIVNSISVLDTARLKDLVEGGPNDLIIEATNGIGYVLAVEMIVTCIPWHWIMMSNFRNYKV